MTPMTERHATLPISSWRLSFLEDKLFGMFVHVGNKTANSIGCKIASNCAIFLCWREQPPLTAFYCYAGDEH